MEYLEYTSANTSNKPDVRRMRAVLVKAGYMASENDIERLWDDYSSTSRGKWVTPPSDDAELLQILLVGFGIEAIPDDAEDWQPWPAHWANRT
jgi:hypothetical protein